MNNFYDYVQILVVAMVMNGCLVFKYMNTIYFLTNIYVQITQIKIYFSNLYECVSSNIYPLSNLTKQ